jgi:hypothetical protein
VVSSRMDISIKSQVQQFPIFKIESNSDRFGKWTRFIGDKSNVASFGFRISKLLV